MSSERLDDRDDFKVLADLELLREKADDLSKLDDEVMYLLLRADAREEDLDFEMQELTNTQVSTRELIFMSRDS
jgi:hypothetical protein